jgi:hypothetical protein
MDKYELNEDDWPTLNSAICEAMQKWQDKWITTLTKIIHSDKLNDTVSKAVKYFHYTLVSYTESERLFFNSAMKEQ